MDERRLQLRIGLSVLAAALAAATLIAMFGEGFELFTPHYTIYIKVPSAEGVSRQTAIHKRGIRIGRVEDVQLLEGQVLITAEIEKGRTIHRNEICRIYPSVLGEADVNFALPQDEEPSKEILAPGETVPGVISRDPMQMIGDLEGDFSRMIRSVTSTTEETRDTMRRVADLFERNENRINSIVEKVDENMDTIRTTLDNANELLGDADFRDSVKQSANELPDLLHDARDTLDRISEMSVSAQRNLDNLDEFTLALREQGTDVIQNLDDGASQFRSMLDEMSIFSQKLNRTDTTFGLLMNDRRLYDNINSTVTTIEELSRSLRPVVNDARVFSDKIARHPELLGVRGAIQRNDGTKGVPVYPMRR